MAISNNQQLELTWIAKAHRPELEPRILMPDKSKSYHAKHRPTESEVLDRGDQ